MDDEISTLVIDAGSSTFRAGLAGNEYPACVFPSAVGSLRFSKDRGNGFVGHQLESMLDLLTLRYPIQRGIVTNWDDMELMMSHCYEELGVNPTEHPVLFSYPPLNPKSSLEMLAQMMFEKYDVPAMEPTSSSFLCLYACGRNSAVMVNIGEGVSYAVPFYESYCISHGIQRQDFAGQDVTNCLNKSLLEKGYSFTTTSEIDSICQMKEKLCYTALDFEAEMRISEKSQELESCFTGSGGNNISIKEERFRSMEALFQPSKFGFQGFVGIPEMIHRAIQSCPLHTKGDILVNIILSGGTIRNKGFLERVKKEVKLLYPNKRVQVLGPPESKISVWIGGSVLGSLSAFQWSLISKQRYEEYGPSIVHRQFHHCDKL